MLIRKRHIVWIVCVCVALIWVGPLLGAGVFTACFGDEFADYEQLGVQGYMCYVEGHRVLFYSSKKAVVYFYNDNYGERNVYQKKNGKWVLVNTTAAWSTEGNAEDYLIWPYYKNYVP